MSNLLLRELRGSFDFFLDLTNRDPQSPGFGLTADSTKAPAVCSIAAVGFALTAWVIGCERGYFTRDQARQMVRGTLRTLFHRASHHRGFFAHFLDMQTARRRKKCEYSTIDTALCLNGVLTASAYFADDAEIGDWAAQLLERVDWNFLVFEREGRTLFRMSYNPDEGGDYVTDRPGLIGQWDMAAEQKMMYLQAAPRLEPSLATALYRGFRRERGEYNGHAVIINPQGTLFAYLYTEAWLDTARYLDPDGVDWFENTRQAVLANREFCIAQSNRYRTYHANSWGLSAGDSPHGYDVFGGLPCRGEPHHDGTISIYAAAASLPFVPDSVMDMLNYLYRHHPQTWGKYGFFDAYNLDVSPAWYSRAVYAINKGCSMIMIENHLSRLVWDIFTTRPYIQKALAALGFRQRTGGQDA